MSEDQPGEKWPRGLEGVQAWASPADPLLPPPSVSGRDEARIARRMAQQLPGIGSPELRPVQFAEAYALLTAVSLAKADFYDQLLAEQYEREGLAGLIGHKIDVDKFGEEHEVSEEIRALVRLSESERDRAAKLIEKGISLGIQARQVDVMRSYGRTVVAALRALCGELGVTWEDAATKRAAQRAILSARTAVGADFAAPDRMGPALSDEDRARILGGGHDHPH